VRAARTGGTGKFLGMRGMIKAVSTFDPKAAMSQTEGEIEYWMER
jgi:hypothetical protein